MTTHSSPPKSFTTVSLTITDDHTQTILSLPRPLFSSARSWSPSYTTLLLSSPRLRGHRLSLTSRSHIEIDPDIPEVIALRRNVQRANIPINAIFPDEIGEAHTQELRTNEIKLQFTFSSLCDFIADSDTSFSSPQPHPQPLITGYLPLLLTRINLTSLISRKRLFSMPCCSMPIYSNTPHGICGQCDAIVALRINPDVVGGMADETGGFALSSSSSSPTQSRTSGSSRAKHSPLLWSDTAWRQLLGREAGELAEIVREDVSGRQKRENGNVVRYLERRLEWMRVVLVVGWMEGRVGILEVVA